MKKILLLFSVAGLLTLTGCNGDDATYVNQTVENEVFQVGPVNFAYNATLDKYASAYDLDPQIESADVVLVYRRTFDPSANNVAVWELIPRTLHLGPTDEIDYDFNFNQNSILFTVDANYNLLETPAYINDQVFRVVILPGYDNSAKMNFNDYEAVAKRYNIKESNIKMISK